MPGVVDSLLVVRGEWDSANSYVCEGFTSYLACTTPRVFISSRVANVTTPRLATHLMQASRAEQAEVEELLSLVFAAQQAEGGASSVEGVSGATKKRMPF